MRPRFWRGQAAEMQPASWEAESWEAGWQLQRQPLSPPFALARTVAAMQVTAANQAPACWLTSPIAGVQLHLSCRCTHQLSPPLLPLGCPAVSLPYSSSSSSPVIMLA